MLHKLVDWCKEDEIIVRLGPFVVTSFETWRRAVIRRDRENAYVAAKLKHGFNRSLTARRMNEYC